MTIQLETTIHRTTVDTTILAMRTPLTTPLMISTLVTASTQGTRWMILLGWIILIPVLETLVTRIMEEGLMMEDGLMTEEGLMAEDGLMTEEGLMAEEGLMTEEAPGVTTVVVIQATVGGRGLAIFSIPS